MRMMSPDRINMKHFNKWAKDKSPLLAMSSLMLAVFAEVGCALIKIFREEKFMEGLVSLPPLTEWLSLYRNQKKVLNNVYNTFTSMNEDFEQIINLFDILVGMLREYGPFETIRIIENPSCKDEEWIGDYVREWFPKTQEIIMREYVNFARFGVDDEEGKIFRDKYFTPEVIFFLKIWIPCLLFYGESVPTILRRARQGNYDDIEKLLKLDPSIIHDSRIKEIHHKATVAKERGKINRMTKALQLKPRMKADIRKVRYNMAGLLSGYSIVIGEELTAKDINNLFIAVALDMGRDATDVDLMVKSGTKKLSKEEDTVDFINEETLTKEIYNSRILWKIFPLPERK